MKIYTTEEITNKLKRKKKIKKILNIILYPVFILIVICMAILLVQKIKNPDRVPDLFGYKAFSIISGSMQPTLNIGDLIIIKNVEQHEIKKGDIISFSEKDSIVTHRIIEMVEENGRILYQTKGDSNNKNDERMITYEEIEGVYKLKIPQLGKIVISAQNMWGMIIILGIIYFTYIIFDEKEKRKIYRHEKRKKFEKEEQK